MARGRPGARRWLALAALVLVYAAALYLGRAARPDGDQVALTWPAAGAGVWLMWALRRRGPMVVGAAVVAVVNLAVAVDTGAPVVAGVVFALVNALHATLGASLLHRAVPPARGLRGPGDVGLLLAVSAVAGTVSGVLSAVVAATLLDHSLLGGLLLFVVRNIGMTFIVMGAVLSVSAPHRLRDLVARERTGELAAVLAVGVVVHGLVFGVTGDLPTLFLATGVAVWVGSRLGVARAGMVALVFCAAAVTFTILDRGALARVEDESVRAVLVQAFTVVVMLTSLSLATLHRVKDEVSARLAASLRRLEEANERLSHLAHHDALTGLPNRARLHTDLDAMLADPRAARVAVVFLDLDRFKAVNDTLGHDTGDAVLVQVARALRGTLRDVDLVSRYGGDEFVVACPGVPDGAAAAELGARLAAAVTEALTVDGGPVSVGVSVGVALAEPGEDSTAVMRRSDSAMYRVKRARGTPVPLGPPSS